MQSPRISLLHVSSLLLAACAHAAGAAPPASRVTSGAVPPEERRLYEIVMQLARDPEAQALLAPDARVVFHGDEEQQEPLANAQQELGWIADAQPTLVASAAPPADSDETRMRCTAAELRCVIEQPGGETVLRFAQQGEGADRHIVLREVEGAEP